MSKTLSERTGLVFTKKRPRKMPEPPYMMAHCKAGWFVSYTEEIEWQINGPLRSEHELNPDLFTDSPPRLSNKFTIDYGCVSFQLVQDLKHYADGLVVLLRWRTITKRSYVDGRIETEWLMK